MRHTHTHTCTTSIHLWEHFSFPRSLFASLPSLAFFALLLLPEGKTKRDKKGAGRESPLSQSKRPSSLCLSALPSPHSHPPIPLPFPHYLHTAVARPVARSKPYFIPNRPPDRASAPTIHHSPTDPAPDLVKSRVMDIGPLPHHPPTRPGHSLGSFDQTESRRVRIRSGAHSTANSLPIV